MKKNRFKNKKRVVVKIGSSSLTHPKTGNLDFIKLERLVRELCDLRNQDIDVCLVSSGAISVGRKMMGIKKRPKRIAVKQACAAVGQASLMMTYQKLFSEYHQTCGQVLMTKKTMIDNVSRKNAENTFEELFRLGVIPIVNENDTVAIDELVGSHFGDNDTLSAVVAQLVEADALVILTDIDGLYDSDPRKNPDAKRIPVVKEITDEVRALAGGAGSNRGTGGMATKIKAAEIANSQGIPCCVVSGEDPHVLYQLFDGAQIGTIFG